MKTVDFYTKVKQITAKDLRYHYDAYEFINDAVIYTVTKLDKLKEENEKRHITGQELLKGIREFALKQFGPMTYTVFNEWGVNDGLAVGNIVFNMVEYKILSSCEQDSIKDFENAFDFTTAFCDPFIPKGIEIPPLPVLA